MADEVNFVLLYRLDRVRLRTRALRRAQVDAEDAVRGAREAGASESEILRAQSDGVRQLDREAT